MWQPQTPWRGNAEPLRVSASNLAGHATTCPEQAGFDIRPGVFAELGGWKKAYPENDKFVLGIVREMVQAVHRDSESGTFAGLQNRIKQELARRDRLHPALKVFAAEAVERYVEIHEEIESEIGTLKLVEPDDQWRGYILNFPGRQLTAWALMYESGDGCREIRRLRMTGGPSSGDATAWMAAAAKIAARDPRPERVRVVEIGVGDSSLSVVFDGSAGEARALFEEKGRPFVPVLAAGGVPVPGRGCGDCKLVGGCSALVQIPGALGLTSRGIATRSVSASDLETYTRCPARWLLERDQHLPKQADITPGQARGIAVHRWLRAAHQRGVACSERDLPAPGSASLGVAEGVLDESEYATAYPYLVHHVDQCPLAAPNATCVVSEESVYCYDSVADLVAATKPDLRFTVADTFVLFETKTLDGELPGDDGEAFDAWFSVAWGLTVLAHGLARHQGVSRGELRLEVLTPSGGRVFVFETGDALYVRLARDEVRLRVSDWHTDDQWEANPDRHCEWCPVARWCPSAEAWLNRTPEPAPGLPS